MYKQAWDRCLDRTSALWLNIPLAVAFEFKAEDTSTILMVATLKFFVLE
jgi:hypothetical protein